MAGTLFRLAEDEGRLRAAGWLGEVQPGGTDPGSAGAAQGQGSVRRSAVLDAEPWLKTGMRLSLCGMRRSEGLGLDWTSVDLKTGAVRVTASRTKDGVGSDPTLNAPNVKNGYRTMQAEVVHPGTARTADALARPGSSGSLPGHPGRRWGAGEPDAYSRRSQAPAGPRVSSTTGAFAACATRSRRRFRRQAFRTCRQRRCCHDVQTFRRFHSTTDDDGAAAAT